ncbi:flagellar biosynthetic protein FliR [Phaeovulum sp.]|uniref:flagellar biosynthetic protein FliR n=1 Tax=Phaeovulum sp. TaxID=2934796 RepID=UPI0039E39643
MNEHLTDALNYTNRAFFEGFIVFLRVGGAMALLPDFGEQSLPVRVRLALTIAFTMVVAPIVSQDLTQISSDDTVLAPYLATEPTIGLALGMVLRLFVIALQIAGAIIAQAISLAQLFGGSAGEPQPAVGHLLVMGGLALAVMTGLHVDIARALVETYQVFTPGSMPAAADIRMWGLSGVVHCFSLAFSLAAPFVIGGLIYNVALGAINRAMPQLMVAFVGAPALTAGGLVLLAIAIPTALLIWYGALNDFLINPFQAAP